MARTTIREEDITSGAVPTTGIVGTSVFTASGTWTKATRESALGVTIKRVIVEVQGAGGGGAGTTNTYGQGGGGGGGYAKKLIDVSSISSSTVTIGSGGSHGTGSPLVNGGNGGDSSWSDGTNTVTGSGGSGALSNNTTAFNPAGFGGSASGGDINISGIAGDNNGEGGGGSVLGLVTSGRNGLNGATYPMSSGYGSGGCGGDSDIDVGNGAYKGADGMNGIVIVTEIAG